MTSTSRPATLTGPTTSQLIDRATRDGIRVFWQPPSWHLPAAYAAEASAIWLRRDLTEAEARSLLAHEMAHAHYRDRGTQPPPVEARAWRWAARALVTPAAYAAAEQLVGPAIGALADHLGVTREVVIACQADLMRRTHR